MTLAKSIVQYCGPVCGILQKLLIYCKFLKVKTLINELTNYCRDITAMITTKLQDHPDVSKSFILVVGGIGHGKSSFINSLSGRNACKVGHTWGVDETITEDVHEIEVQQKENVIVFIDTPSFRTLSNNPKFKELFKTGFHAIVIVYSIKSTQSLSPVIQELKHLLGDNFYEHSLIVLTFEDYLGESNVEDFLATNSDLKKLSKKTPFKCIPFNNLLENDSKKAQEQKTFFIVHLDAIRRHNKYLVIKRKGVCPNICDWIWSCFQTIFRWFKLVLNLDG